MFEKFGLEFRIFTKDLEAATPSGNPFEDIDHLIVRLDQMSRNEELQEKLCAAGWDLVVFDEAHKLAALGGKAEAIRQLAYRLYTLCERVGFAEDARAYNELITSWTGIESAANRVPKPPEMKQGNLFEN